MLSLKRLERLLRGVHKSTFVTLTTFTRVDKMYKTVHGEENPYYKRVWKRARVNGGIYFWYENSVNNQREREQKERDFVALERRYGTHIAGTPLVIHEDGERLYLPMQVKSWLEYQYEIDGEVIPCEDIEYWLRPEPMSRQGVERPVIYRNFLLTSITNIAIHGEWFAVNHPQLITV